ncbi:MAG: hypothetical protein ABW199_03820 [Caulobacterales bacterium]
MKIKLAIIALAAAMAVTAGTADARRHERRPIVPQTFPVAPVLADPEYTTLLAGVTFHFGAGGGGRVIAPTSANHTASAFHKSDEVACSRALANSLIALHDAAIAQGGNAVVNIKSNYNDVLFNSTTEFQCGVGGPVARVSLTGTIVRR